jgi:hypothetical protein
MASVSCDEFYEYLRSMSIVSRNRNRVSCPLSNRMDIYA